MGAIDRIQLSREPRTSLAEMPRVVDAVRELLAAIGEAHAAGRSPTAAAHREAGAEPGEEQH